MLNVIISIPSFCPRCQKHYNHYLVSTFIPLGHRFPRNNRSFQSCFFWHIEKLPCVPCRIGNRRSFPNPKTSILDLFKVSQRSLSSSQNCSGLGSSNFKKNACFTLKRYYHMVSRHSLPILLNMCPIPPLLFKSVFFLILNLLIYYVKLKFATKSIAASAPQTLTRRVVYPFPKTVCAKYRFHSCLFLSTLSAFPLPL